MGTIWETYMIPAHFLILSSCDPGPGQRKHAETYVIPARFQYFPSPWWRNHVENIHESSTFPDTFELRFRFRATKTCKTYINNCMITDDSIHFGANVVQKPSKNIYNHRCFLHEISVMCSGLWNYLAHTFPGGSCTVSPQLFPGLLGNRPPLGGRH